MAEKKKKYLVGEGIRKIAPGPGWGYEIVDDSRLVTSSPVPKPGDRDYWMVNHPEPAQFDAVKGSLRKKLTRHEIDSAPVPLHNPDGSLSIHSARRDQTDLQGLRDKRGGLLSTDLMHSEHYHEGDKLVDRDRNESGYTQKDLIKLQQELATRGARPGKKREKQYYSDEYGTVPESVAAAPELKARGGYVCSHCEQRAKFADSLKYRRK